MLYILGVWIEWAEQDAQHIATRSQRYPDALDLAATGRDLALYEEGLGDDQE